MTRPPEEQQRVAQAAMPGVAIGASPTAATFGAGPAAVSADLGLALYARATREADQTAVLDADTQLARASVTLQTKILDLKGRDAMRAPALIEEEWQKAVGEIADSLATEPQRALLRPRAQHRGLALEEAAQHHMATEGARYQDQVTQDSLQASIDNARLQASTNPDFIGIVNTEKGSQAKALAEWAQRHGVPLDSAIYTHRVASVVSTTNTEVIKGLLYNGKEPMAQEFYGAHKEEFVAADRDAIEKVLEESTYRGEAQRLVREWVAAGKDLQDSLEEVDKIDDPKLAQLTRDLTKQRFDDIETVKKRGQEKIFEISSKLVEAKIMQSDGQTVDARMVIGPDRWLQLTEAMRRSLQTQAREGLHPADRANDDDRWFKFHNQLTLEQVANLAPSDYRTKYRDHFSNAYREKADAYYQTMRGAAEKKEAKDPALSVTQSFKDQTEDTFRTSGFIDANKPLEKWTVEEKKMYIRFERQAADAIEQTELALKKKLTPSEKQVLINGVRDEAIKKVFVERGFFGFRSEVPVLGLEEDEKGRAVVPVDKIPKAHLEALKNYMLSLGKTPTLDKLRRAYGQVLLKNRKALDAIVNE